jgi:TPR repeat protein
MSRHAARLMLTALALATVGFQSSPAVAADAAKVLESLEAEKPNWLPDLDRCPGDVMPARETESQYSKERCATALERCLDNCRAGDAGDCYASAQILIKVRQNAVAESIFLRACSLGIVSGGTNRAAGMDAGDGGSCAIRTFDMACGRNDPWACTMIGFHLARGIGTAKDPVRARQALAKSCRYGETDQACSYARRVLTEIGE